MEIRIDRSSDIPLYVQISRGIRRMIVAGQLPAGFRLPPERRLAQALGVNRSTVLSAYRELKADGLVDGHVGRGTAVLGGTEVRGRGEPAGSGVPALAWAELARAGSAREPDPLIRDLLELTERPDVVSLAIGLPAPEMLPLEDLATVQSELLARRGPELLLHSPTEGVTALREALGDHMLARGARASAAEILVTSGSQQGLDLIARALLDPGDAVIVEQPSYFGALEVFRGAGCRLVGVPADADGMRTDRLERVLARERPKLIYTLPTFQNPSGAVLALDRRRQLLELAYRFQVPVVEDDPYAELRYDGAPLPSLKALDRHGYVVHLGSFSKILFPGLRIGWLAAPRPLVHRLALVKQSVDLHSSTYGQWIVQAFLESGRLARHLDRVRPEYARRRDALLSALADAAPVGFSWNRPAGGFYVWCRYPAGIPARRLLAEAARERVSYLPGAACFAGEQEDNFLRLDFSWATPEVLRDGVARLARAVRAAARDVPAGRVPSGTRPIV